MLVCGLGCGLVGRRDFEFTFLEIVEEMMEFERLMRRNGLVGAAENGCDAEKEKVGVVGFGDVVVGTIRHRKKFVGFGVLAGDHDDWDVGGLAKFFEDDFAVQVRKIDVEKDEVGIGVGKRGDEVVKSFGRGGFVAVGLEQGGEFVANSWVVFDNENFRHGFILSYFEFGIMEI